VGASACELSLAERRRYRDDDHDTAEPATPEGAHQGGDGDRRLRRDHRRGAAEGEADAGVRYGRAGLEMHLALMHREIEEFDPQQDREVSK
jgi:hypothetical protein